MNNITKLTTPALTNLNVPLLFDGGIQFNAGLSLPAISQGGAVNLVDWLMIGRREYLFFGRRFEQT